MKNNIDLFKNIINKPFWTSEVIMNFIGRSSLKKTMLVLLIGILIGLSFFIFKLKEAETRNKLSIYAIRTESTRKALRTIENRNNILESEIFLLNDKILELLKKKENIKLIKLSKYLGSKPYTKEGILITLTDSSTPIINAEDPSDRLIHNADLLKLTNILWEQGANAISINDERILFDTEIICVGPTILINKKRVSSPFIIKAGGNAEKLAQIEQSGLITSLKIKNIEFSYKKVDNIDIPASDKMIIKKED